jgi:hypothetical protein
VSRVTIVVVDANLAGIDLTLPPRARVAVAGARVAVAGARAAVRGRATKITTIKTT